MLYSGSGIGKLIVVNYYSILFMFEHDSHWRSASILPLKRYYNTLCYLPIDFISVFSFSNKRLRNYWTSCWSEPLKTYNSISMIFFSFTGETLLLESKHFAISAISYKSGCLSDLNFSSIKYFSKIGVAIKHWITELMKHVFPMLMSPLKENSSFSLNFCAELLTTSTN